MQTWTFRPLRYLKHELRRKNIHTQIQRSKPDKHRGRINKSDGSYSQRPLKTETQIERALGYRQRDQDYKRLFVSSGREVVGGTREESAAQLVNERIQKLYTKLSTTKASDEPEISKLHQIDPGETKWPEFRTWISTILQGSRSELKPEQRLWSQRLLAACNGRNPKGEIDHQLWFAFLDFCLDNRRRSDNPLTKETYNDKPIAPDLRYPTEWYYDARIRQREIHLHVGPTNSGKTYNALKRLETAANGFYAGPLRLLAHEVYSRFKAKGISVDLFTGDDVRIAEDPDTKIYASTVEMVDTSREVDVAVIDEIQMMGARERGWAWTRAFLGANAKEVHLCGETRVVPLVRELAATMGDTLHVHEYERLNPLKVASQSLRGNLKALRKGDCVVSFSILGIHALKRQIELETHRRVAIVYGGLPPETRAQQAALFNDPDNDYDYLVASDAIGMGLNLSVKRIIFEKIVKNNGASIEQLSVPQIKQIAGRAGRFRTAQAETTKPEALDLARNPGLAVGVVTCLDEKDLPVIRRALQTEAPPLRRAYISPPGDVIGDLAARVPKGVPFEFLLQRVCDTARLHPRFALCDLRDSLANSRVTDKVPGLTTDQRFILSASPASTKDELLTKVLLAYARAIATQRQITVADVAEVPLEVLEMPLSPEREYLHGLENLHKSLVLFLWLTYRFPAVFREREMATRAKELCEDCINRTLREFSANPRLRNRLLKIKAEQAEGGELLARLQQQPLEDQPETTWDISEDDRDKHGVPTEPSESLIDEAFVIDNGESMQLRAQTA